MVNHYPKDWRIVLLSELSIEGFQNGLFYEVARKNKGIPIINVGDLYKSSPIANDKLELFNATAEEIKRYQVFNGDLFFTRSSIVPSGIAFCNWYRCSEKKAVVFDSHVVRFKTNTDVVNPMYLYLACIRPDARKYFLANAKTATMTTIDQTVLGRCPIPYPALKEQTAIAEAVSDADNLIFSLQKLIEKKKAIKQGTMQELLTGKKRLPGFCQKWAKKYLKEIIVPRKERINPEEIDNRKCIELEHIEPNSGKILGYCESKEQKSLKTIFYPNDILWGKLRPYLRKYAHPKFSGVCSTEFWVFNAINQYACNDFMYYLLQTEDFVSAANSTTGTKMPRADWNLVQELEVKIPADKSEQRAIAQVLSDMDSEIDQLEKKLAKYQQIKQGMMQELLTGRIRLKEGENNA